MHIQIPSHLSDTELIAEVKRLAASEREATAHLIAHIAELDARRLYLAAGFPSLFAYCREVLELSEQSTYNRIEAARAARRFPAILDMLSTAEVTLATARLLASHLTADNHEELLQAASHKSKREVELLLARRFPQPDVPASMRKVRRVSSPAPPQTPFPESHEPQILAAPDADGNPLLESGSPAPAPTAAIVSMPAPAPSISAAQPRQSLRPLAEDRFEIRFTAPGTTCEKLKLAQDLLRHAVPTGDMADVFDRALTALLENLAKQKFGATAHPKTALGDATAQTSASPGTGSRHIPADVRRKVWLRDLGRCSFTSTVGRRCGTRGFLEFHHVQPFAAGGPATPDNIQLRCRAHNDYEAELYFGPRSNDGRAAFIREPAIREPVFREPSATPEPR
jgi:hypothetical protein